MVGISARITDVVPLDMFVVLKAAELRILGRGILRRWRLVLLAYSVGHGRLLG
jgi:hypothetical protein